jgi:thioredoxin 1
MSEEVDYITDETFEADVSAGNEPILLDFTAEWCEPCKAMDPALEQIREQFAGRLRVLKVDLDESPDTCARFSVLSIPTLLLMSKDGVPQYRLGGPKTYDQLVEAVDAFLAE